ncbi:hypothetical protein [Streptomyces sp. NPDC102437]|uniref:hypothetical protein n=1 Tax=Streptomyces sp. NPDC102437 TaxID=3366175 RepID=UPI0037FF60D0
MNFGGAAFADGYVNFDGAAFAGGIVHFDGPTGGATFSGATVDFRNASGPAPDGLLAAVGTPVPATVYFPSAWLPPVP